LRSAIISLALFLSFTLFYLLISRLIWVSCHYLNVLVVQIQYFTEKNTSLFNRPV